MLERRVDADGLRVSLAVDQAREAVDAVATDARAPGRGLPVLVLIEHDPDRQVRRVQAELLEIIAETLNTRLVLHRREGIVAAPRTVGRILLGRAVHDVELLGVRVPRLEVVVGDRPGRRDAAVVRDHAEVLGAQPEERGAVELRVATDVIVLLGHELLAARVDPLLSGRVLALEEHCFRAPVVAFPWEVAASFEQQDALASRGELPRERPAARTAPDDHDVVVLVCHEGS